MMGTNYWYWNNRKELENALTHTFLWHSFTYYMVKGHILTANSILGRYMLVKGLALTLAAPQHQQTVQFFFIPAGGL